MGITPGTAPLEVVEGEVETTSAGTAAKRGTWHLIALNLRCVAAVARKGTSRMIALSLRSASTAAKKATVAPIALNQSSAESAGNLAI